MEWNEGHVEWNEGHVEWNECHVEWNEGRVEWNEGHVEWNEGCVEWNECHVEWNAIHLELRQPQKQHLKSGGRSCKRFIKYLWLIAANTRVRESTLASSKARPHDSLVFVKIIPHNNSWLFTNLKQ